MKFLLEKKNVDINEKDIDGNSALHLGILSIVFLSRTITDF
jgi:hypothetical protein